MVSVWQKVYRLSLAPPDNGEILKNWLRQGDAIAFLSENAEDSDIVVYAALPHIYIHTVLVPNKVAAHAKIDDLLSWNCNAYSSWKIVSSASATWIEPPLTGAGSRAIPAASNWYSAGPSRVFRSGDTTLKYYRNSYRSRVSIICRIAERGAGSTIMGTLTDVVCVRNIDPAGAHYGELLLRFIEMYCRDMKVAKSTMIRMFEFTRSRPDAAHFWQNQHEQRRSGGSGLHYRYGTDEGQASYSRGVQIVDIAAGGEFDVHCLTGRASDGERYVTFIANDWKNGRVAEISCAPSALADYFHAIGSSVRHHAGVFQARGSP